VSYYFAALHLTLMARRVTPLVLEAFIVRLYREKNKMGFVKAFTDQPEHITSGLSPLKNIMKELQVRTVHIYPRFQEDIKKSLERRRADVVELSQPLTEPMANIHHAIIQCMNTTLSELKRSNTTVRFTSTLPSSLTGHYSLTSTSLALKTPIFALLTSS
jgi:DNA excision repair protein ERCC-4